MGAQKTVTRFSLFPEQKRHAERSIRLGLQISLKQLSFNIGVPYFLIVLAYWTNKPDKNILQTSKSALHVWQKSIGTFFRFGLDRFEGEIAILMPLLKIWFIADLLSISRRQQGQFNFLQFLFKFSFFELMLRFKLLGLGFYIHFPFYEIPFIGAIRDKRNRKFFSQYSK